MHHHKNALVQIETLGSIQINIMTMSYAQEANLSKLVNQKNIIK